MSDIRVRFAPSPTGPLHMGGVRTALYNYLFARKHGGKMILRIEDTDQNRFVAGAEDYIERSFEWCGIQFDEGVQAGGDFGPYKQSERSAIYREYIGELLEKGHAYYAFDTPEELDALRNELEAKKETFVYDTKSRMSLRNSLSLSKEETEKLLLDGTPYVIRFKIPENTEISFTDIIRGTVKVHSSTLDDKVLFKTDGLPTYHLANIVDDHLMQISHVIRGEEWLPSAPLHVLLYEAFEWEKPQFAHLPVILKPVGKGKLSKRDGDKMGFPVFPLEWKDPKSGETFAGYREDGYLPEAFVNMLALLGWNPGTEQEVFPMEELIQAFDLERVVKSGAKFNPDKAKWFNQQFIRLKSDQELAQAFDKILKEKSIEAPIGFTEKIVALVKERVEFIQDFWTQAHFFYRAPEEYDAKVAKKRWKEDTGAHITEMIEKLRQVEIWQANDIKDCMSAFIQEKELNMGQMMNAIRLSLVGSSMGPDLALIAELIGKDECLARLTKAVERIKK